MTHIFVRFGFLDSHCLMQAVIEKRCHVKFRLPSQFVVEDNDHTEYHRRYHVNLTPSLVSNSTSCQSKATHPLVATFVFGPPLIYCFLVG